MTDLLVSHVVVSVVFATSGLCAGWWLRRHWPTAQFLQDVDDAQLTRELMASLHRLSVCMAADVDEHTTRVGEVDRELATRPDPTSAAISVLADRLLQANETVQAKLSHAESKLDELTDRMELHATEARTDVLTGMPNRRAFEEEAYRRLTASQEAGAALSLVLIDIDRFKLVNDELGHPLGDKVLRRVGATLLAHSPWHHFVSRYGGEEFAILMPGTSLEEARGHADDLRTAVHNAKYRVGSTLLGVTISAGVAQLLASEDMPSLIQRTDKAMYAAKHAGRDRVCWHDGAQTRTGRTDPSKAQPVCLQARPSMPVTPVEVTPVETPAVSVESCRPRAAAPGVLAAADIDMVEPQHIDLELLSNLNNKTMFCQQVHRRICEFNRGGPAFSTVLLNVDNYAQLARDHGAPAAELALGVVAQAIRDRVRSMDMVAKYNESTFALILPGAMLRHAVCIGERLRKEICRTGIMVDGQSVHFTVSLGIVEVADGDEMATHVERAAHSWPKHRSAGETAPDSPLPSRRKSLCDDQL